MGFRVVSESDVSDVSVLTLSLIAHSHRSLSLSLSLFVVQFAHARVTTSQLVTAGPARLAQSTAMSGGTSRVRHHSHRPAEAVPPLTNDP